MNVDRNERLFIEEEGKNVDAAVNLALEKLKVTRELADVEILAAGSKGFLNMIGGKKAKVRVTIRNEAWQEKVRTHECLGMIELGEVHKG